MKNILTNKVVVIALLAGILLIPLSLIESVIIERSAYRDQARSSVSESWTTAQQFIGPLLIVPYKVHYTERVWNKLLEQYEDVARSLDKVIYLAPEVLTVDGTVGTELRKRGIYGVPIYHSELAIAGSFNLRQLSEIKLEPGHTVEWQPAYLSVMISDLRGVIAQPKLQWQEQTFEFVSDTNIDGMRGGMHAEIGVPEPQEQSVAFSFKLLLNGMDTLQFAPVGNSTQVHLNADWPHPSFIGRHLPTEHAINEAGFNASWQLSSFSSGIAQSLKQCREGHCNALKNEVFGVRLFNSVDIYQQSERSVKYGLLFVVLTFVCIFLYEVMKGLRLHPMQYLLVGSGLSVFYLLLISLAEHMAFGFAYLLATAGSTVLISFYLGGVLANIKHGGVVGVVLSLLYALLYGILSSEDNSLLMGTLLIFSVLTVVMVATRKLDWYSVAAHGSEVQ